MSTVAAPAPPTVADRCNGDTPISNQDLDAQRISPEYAQILQRLSTMKSNELSNRELVVALLCWVLFAVPIAPSVLVLYPETIGSPVWLVVLLCVVSAGADAWLARKFELAGRVFRTDIFSDTTDALDGGEICHCIGTWVVLAMIQALMLTSCWLARGGDLDVDGVTDNALVWQPIIAYAIAAAVMCAYMPSHSSYEARFHTRNTDVAVLKVWRGVRLRHGTAVGGAAAPVLLSLLLPIFQVVCSVVWVAMDDEDGISTATVVLGSMCTAASTWLVSVLCLLFAGAMRRVKAGLLDCLLEGAPHDRRVRLFYGIHVWVAQALARDTLMRARFAAKTLSTSVAGVLLLLAAALFRAWTPYFSLPTASVLLLWVWSWLVWSYTNSLGDEVAEARQEVQRHWDNMLRPTLAGDSPAGEVVRSCTWYACCPRPATHNAPQLHGSTPGVPNEDDQDASGNKKFIRDGRDLITHLQVKGHDMFAKDLDALLPLGSIKGTVLGAPLMVALGVILDVFGGLTQCTE